jgi:hypothetical protein
VNNPVPAKSSNPTAKLGLLLFFGLYLNLTLKPLSKYSPGSLPSQTRSDGR